MRELTLSIQPLLTQVEMLGALPPVIDGQHEIQLRASAMNAAARWLRHLSNAGIRDVEVIIDTEVSADEGTAMAPGNDRDSWTEEEVATLVLTLLATASEAREWIVMA